jgi:hypothetical protein
VPPGRGSQQADEYESRMLILAEEIKINHSESYYFPTSVYDEWKVDKTIRYFTT